MLQSLRYQSRRTTEQLHGLCERFQRALWAWRQRIALNPTSDLWLALLQNGFPFIKRELLRFNPGHAPDLHVWHRMVREQAPQMYRLIIDDLKLTIRKQAP